MQKQKIKPQHEVCRVNVAVPTILIEPFNSESKEPEIFVQWFGESEFNDLDGMQFKFCVPRPVDWMGWMNHPELFRVVFMGQVKDWPNQEVVHQVAEMIEGDLNSYVIYVVTTHYAREYPSGVGPGSLMIPMTVILADSTGIIHPMKYCDMKVLEEANQEVAQQKSKMVVGD